MHKVISQLIVVVADIYEGLWQNRCLVPRRFFYILTHLITIKRYC